MAIWDLKELRNLVASFTPNDQVVELVKFTDSFDWKSKALFYHCYTAEKCLAPFENLELTEVSQKVLAIEEKKCWIRSFWIFLRR